MSETLSQYPVDYVEHGLVVGRRANGRNTYSKEGKRRLVEICLQPGISLAKVALQNGLNANLLRRWVSDSLKGRRSAVTGMPVAGTGQFLPVFPIPKSARVVATDPLIEIDIVGVIVRLRGTVNPAQLRQVLDCLTQP